MLLKGVFLPCPLPYTPAASMGLAFVHGAVIVLGKLTKKNKGFAANSSRAHLLPARKEDNFHPRAESQVPGKTLWFSAVPTDALGKEGK